MHSITCLNEKNLFIWVCLILEKKSQKAKTNKKNKRDETPEKKRVAWVILYWLLPLRRHLQSHAQLEKWIWLYNELKWPLSNFRLAYRFSRTFFIRFIYWLFIHLFIILLNYLSIFSRINFSRIATLQKKKYTWMKIYQYRQKCLLNSWKLCINCNSQFHVKRKGLRDLNNQRINMA